MRPSAWRVAVGGSVGGLLETRLLLALAVLQTAERHLLLLFLALADDGDVDGLADRRRGHDARQIPRVLHLPAVEADDHVAHFEPCGLCRALLVDAGDEGAPRATETEGLGGGVVHVLDADAEPAAPGLAELPELVYDRDGGGGRNGEANAHRPARGRQDGRVDPDHLALHVE